MQFLFIWGSNVYWQCLPMSRWYDPLIPKALIPGVDVRVNSRHASLCVLCRGGRGLCGKAVCPIELKAKAYLRVKGFGPISTSLEGSSPPSVFVGRFGYPYVNAGPMVPPVFGETGVMDCPESWLAESVDSIVNYRYSLVRGSARLAIDSARRGGRLVEALQELSMGTSPAGAAIEFLKKPAGTVSFDDNSQPFGPSAPLKSFDISSVKVDHRIENAYYDTDLRAGEAVMGLYDSGLRVSQLQKAFSMGVFGVQKNRRLVPTRWSITAVDSIISGKLIGEVKGFETVDKYLVYARSHQYNTFAAVLMPQKWSFEWMEAWFPGTFWNLGGPQVAVEGDYEGYSGRKTYPGIGGCYFSTRLAVAEHLRSLRRQASALVVREIRPEFPLPLGVWFVRENVREMLRKPPAVFDDLGACLSHLKGRLRVPVQRWIGESTMLRDHLLQRRMDDYLRLKGAG